MDNNRQDQRQDQQQFFLIYELDRPKNDLMMIFFFSSFNFLFYEISVMGPSAKF